MSQLCEKVTVKTAWHGQELQGELFVGADGLPMLRVFTPPLNCLYLPWTLPAAWKLEYVLQAEPPTLFSCWQAIENIQRQIQDAQREADAEERREPDCIDEYKRDAEVKGAR